MAGEREDGEKKGLSTQACLANSFLIDALYKVTSFLAALRNSLAVLLYSFSATAREAK